MRKRFLSRSGSQLLILTCLLEGLLILGVPVTQGGVCQLMLEEVQRPVI